MMRKLKLLLQVVLTLLTGIPTGFAVGARVKDISVLGGARDNQLVGYGLVAGLAGNGDKNQTYTLQTMANVLMRFGINIPSSTIQAKNVAVVMVTADIAAFVKPGERLDVTVSSMGDADTLQGGMLLQTPLMGGDGKVYAVAQGAVSIGGFSAGTEGAGGATVQKNHPTVGQIIGGALVEREIPTTIVRDNTIDLLLREPDFTSASRMATAINERFPQSAQALDATTVRVSIPAALQNATVDFVAQIQAVEITPDVPARHHQ